MLVFQHIYIVGGMPSPEDLCICSRSGEPHVEFYHYSYYYLYAHVHLAQLGSIRRASKGLCSEWSMGNLAWPSKESEAKPGYFRILLFIFFVYMCVCIQFMGP